MPSAPDDLPLALRTAMRQLAGGVSLVTVGTGADRAGFTATSVTSLTLEPPCVLVCVNRAVSAWPRIQAERRFGVSILSEYHHDLAVRFSGATGVKGAARFDQGCWAQAAIGVPLLSDGLVGVACELEDAIERHSHLILVGAVRGISFGDPGTPLIYADGSYGRFAALGDAVADVPAGRPRRQASEQ